MPLPADVTAALVRSRFGALPDDALARLTAGAIRVEVPAGTGLIEPGTVPRLHLMVAGVAKTYLIAPNGRQATVRHARSGEIVAATSVCDQRRQCLPGFRTLSAVTVLILSLLLHRRFAQPAATSKSAIEIILYIVNSRAGGAGLCSNVSPGPGNVTRALHTAAYRGRGEHTSGPCGPSGGTAYSARHDEHLALLAAGPHPLRAGRHRARLGDRADGALRGRLAQRRARRRRRALAITETELKLIAALASIGLSRIPAIG